MVRIDLVRIFVEYIREQGDFDYGIDELEKIGIKGIIALYGLDFEVLTEKEKQELEKELREMAREFDFMENWDQPKRLIFFVDVLFNSTSYQMRL